MQRENTKFVYIFNVNVTTHNRVQNIVMEIYEMQENRIRNYAL